MVSRERNCQYLVDTHYNHHRHICRKDEHLHVLFLELMDSKYFLWNVLHSACMSCCLYEYFSDVAVELLSAMMDSLTSSKELLSSGHDLQHYLVVLQRIAQEPNVKPQV